MFYSVFGETRHSRYILLVKNGQNSEICSLFPSYFIENDSLKYDFHCVYQKLSNKAIVKKHHIKNLYLKSYKPVGTFHLLDLDLNIYCRLRNTRFRYTNDPFTDCYIF